MTFGGRLGSLIIRNFELQDAERLSRLIVQNLRQVNIKDYSIEAINALVPFYTPKQIIGRSKHQYILVCTLNDHLIGTASLDCDRVRNVFVDIAWHKRGVGEELMSSVEVYASEQNLKRIYLTSGLSAYRFYKKLSYKIVKRFDEDLNGVPLPVIRMEKPLITD